MTRARGRAGEPDADRRGDLVAHAGEAELEVAVPAVGGVPHLQQVAGRAAGGGDDRVAGPGVLLEQPDQLGLGEHGVGVGDDVVGLRSQRVEVDGRVGVERRRTHRRPGALPPRPRPARPAPVTSPAGARRRPGPAGRSLASPTTGGAPSRSASRASTLMLANRTSGVGKSECDAGGEVGQPRADGEHEVGLRGELVGRRVALEPDAAELPPGVARTAPLPANVSATGMPTASASARELGARVGVDARRRRR